MAPERHCIDFASIATVHLKQIRNGAIAIWLPGGQHGVTRAGLPERCCTDFAADRLMKSKSPGRQHLARRGRPVLQRIQISSEPDHRSCGISDLALKQRSGRGK